MAWVFVALQFVSLVCQLYFGVKGLKNGDIAGTGNGYAIWGGAVTVLLGLPVQLELVK